MLTVLFSTQYNLKPIRQIGTLGSNGNNENSGNGETVFSIPLIMGKLVARNRVGQYRIGHLVSLFDTPGKFYPQAYVGATRGAARTRHVSPCVRSHTISAGRTRRSVSRERRSARMFARAGLEPSATDQAVSARRRYVPPLTFPSASIKRRGPRFNFSTTGSIFSRSPTTTQTRLSGWTTVSAALFTSFMSKAFTLSA
jgi:hypothetical protein